MRIYVITNKSGNDPERLVEAANQSQALRHVAESLFGVKAANASVVARLMAAGVVVESARSATDGEAE